MQKSLTHAAVLDLAAEAIEFYACFLSSLEGRHAPRRSSIEHLQQQLQEILEEAEPSHLHMHVLATASRHMCDGIPAEELGYPLPSAEEEAAVALLIRQAAVNLGKHADQYGPVATHVLEKLEAGIPPRGAQEFATFLGMVLENGRTRSTSAQA